MRKIFSNILFTVGIAYCLSCDTKLDNSSNNEIIIFSFEEQSEEPKIDAIGASVSAKAVFGTDLSRITPNIVVSKDAIISPQSGIEMDFSKGPVDYIVTAENGEEKTWIVSIYNDIEGLAEIIYCEIANQSNSIVEKDSVFINVPYTTDVSALAPYFTISEGASIFPPSGKVQDFSQGPIKYTVTSANGTVKEWPVLVNRLKATGRYILSFTIDDQIDETIIENKSIKVTMPFGSDVSSVIPHIEISDMATISPEIGKAVDFSVDSTAQFVVTSEEGRNRTYTVQIDFQ